MKTASVVILSAAALLGACAQTDWKMPRLSSSVPANLQPPAGESSYLEVAAKGVQIYECRMDKSGKPEWGFVAPADSCDASRVGTRSRVGYTANYTFFSPAQGAR